MPVRLRRPTQPVTLSHDGDRIEAEAGESLALALLAADRLVLTRSPKLHRPRGPYCLRAACEGCLVRVDGVPNVMACRHRVRGGEKVETQNVVGSRELDLLAATDFMFPHGVDHHRLFAGIPGVSAVVSRLARRIAGLGRLPDEPSEVRRAEPRDVQVLIVGGGAAGLAAAAELGPRATLVDDGLELGGTLRLLDPDASARCLDAARRAGATLMARTTAAGIYPGPAAREGYSTVLLAGEDGACAVFARAVLLTPGVHDAPPDFPGNDLPGVLSVRAGLSLLEGGVLPDARTVLAGSGPLLDRAATLLGERAVERLERDAILRVEGRLRLRHVVARQAGGERRIRAGALLYGAPGHPAAELAVQAGSTLRYEPALGYALHPNPESRAAANVWCAGSVTGAADSAEHGRAVARRIAHSLEPT
jgi:sarcosine oxidase subunit alpha